MNLLKVWQAQSRSHQLWTTNKQNQATIYADSCFKLWSQMGRSKYIQTDPNGTKTYKNSEMPTMFQPMAWNAIVGVQPVLPPEPANETFKQTSWKASCHRYHPSISKSVLSKVEITAVLWNTKATVCPQLRSERLLLAPFKNEHPKFVWWRWLISRMESKARLTMRDISFEQTQSSITDQQSQRHVKGFRKHLSLGIMSFY